MDGSVLRGIMDGSEAFSGPEIVQFDITNRCNNNCLCCWNNSPFLGEILEEKKKEKERELPVHLIKKTIGELSQMGTKVLFFAGGGEPFIHPHIIDILQYAKECKMKVFMNSNFTLIGKAEAKAIVDFKIDHIHASLLAGTAKTYALIHPNKTEKTFHKIKDALGLVSLLKRKKRQYLRLPFPHINLYYVMFNKNYGEIKEMVDLGLEVHADSVEFTPIDVIPGKTDVLLLNEEQNSQIARDVQVQWERLQEYNKGVPAPTHIQQYDSFLKRISSSDASAGRYESETITKQPCYVGWVFVRINANGDVSPCLKSHKIVVGNIYQSAFSQIWNSPKEQLFRRKSFNLDFSDPYFKEIGNDPNCSSGCLQSCDNIQINIDMHNKFKEVLKQYGKISG